MKEVFKYASVALSFPCTLTNITWRKTTVLNSTQRFSSDCSVIPYNFDRDKPIWKYIHLPKTCFERNTTLMFFLMCLIMLHLYFHRPYAFFFLLECFSTTKIFLAFIKIIVDITSAPVNFGWLANFWILTTLIGSILKTLKYC